jgi:hypothetical protein
MPPKEMQATFINLILQTSQHDDIDKIPPRRCINTAKNNAKSESKTSKFVCGQSEMKQIQSMETIRNMMSNEVERPLSNNNNSTHTSFNTHPVDERQSRMGKGPMRDQKFNKTN